MEPIEVTARFDDQGTITPLHFTWKEANYHVESTGRRWQDEVSQHILVMVSNGHIYELIFRREDGRWYIRPAGTERKVI